MKPRITVITLGVDGLETSLRFYRDGLGLPTEGINRAEVEHGAVVYTTDRDFARFPGLKFLNPLEENNG